MIKYGCFIKWGNINEYNSCAEYCFYLYDSLEYFSSKKIYSRERRGLLVIHRFIERIDKD